MAFNKNTIWIAIIVFLLIIIGVLLSRTNTVKQFDAKTTENYCMNNGYVNMQIANNVINVTNRLVDIVNICMQGQNVTPLNHMIFFSEK